MSINFKEALGVHADALQLRAQRTRVLAANIANESTPGYTARDIDFASALQDQRDADGMVFYANVNEVAEMADMMAASRAFETNVEVMGRIKSMQQSLIRMGESCSWSPPPRRPSA